MRIAVSLSSDKLNLDRMDNTQLKCVVIDHHHYLENVRKSAFIRLTGRQGFLETARWLVSSGYRGTNQRFFETERYAEELLGNTLRRIPKDRFVSEEAWLDIFVGLAGKFSFDEAIGWLISKKW